MSDYIISLGAFEDQQFGTQLAALDSDYEYELHSAFAGVADFFSLSGSTLSLASNVYFDFENSRLSKVDVNGSPTSSFDIFGEDWEGLYLVESGSSDFFAVAPSAIDADESAWFTDLNPEEHRVDTAAARINAEVLSGVSEWRVQGSSLRSYFEVVSDELMLRDGWHFDYVADNRLDLVRNALDSEGSVSWSTVSDLGSSVTVVGYDADDDPMYLVDLSVAVEDINEAWTFSGLEFADYTYGAAFASLTGSELSGGEVRSTNDLVSVTEGVWSFAGSARFASEENRVEDFLYQGFDLDSGASAVTYLAQFETGQTRPSYIQAVSADELDTLINGSATSLMRAGIEDNAVLSSLVSNVWFLDTEVTYVFAGAGQTPSASESYSLSSQTSAWPAAQKAVALEAMALISSVCGITFREIESAADADKNLQLVESISTYSGYSGYPYDNTFVVDMDDFDLSVMVHELSHTVGIAHPFEIGNGTTALSGVVQPADPGDNQLNTSYWTVMSYGNVLPDALSVPLGTPPPALSTFDIAALQALYGTNGTTYSTDTVWTAPDEIIVIWDEGGTDTIDLSATSGDCVIDLRSALVDGTADGGGYETYSTESEFDGAFLIARGAEIENGTGGSGNDRIQGNDLSNQINAAAGNDTVRPGLGLDYVLCGEGADSVYLESDATWSTGYVAENIGYGEGTGTGQAIAITGYVKFSEILDGGAGSDSLILTAGNDAFFYHDAFTGIHDQVTTTTDYQSRSTAPRVTEIETIDAGQGNDLIDLTSPDFSLASVDMTLLGGDGNDVLWASGGNDRVEGGDGDDVLFGGDGDDILVGGQGADEFQFTRSSGNDEIRDLDLAEDSITLFAASGDSDSWIMDGSILVWGDVNITLLDYSDSNLNDLINSLVFEVI